MIDRNGLLLIAVALFLFSITLITGFYYRRFRRGARDGWEGILSRLAPLDRENIEMIARDILDETLQQRSDANSGTLESSKVWIGIGGMEGLSSLEANCAVLIDLAFYVQQRHPEALPVTEELRLNARAIAWHVERLKGALRTGKLESSIPMYAQPAIAAYYVMTRRVLALYEERRLPMLVDLQRAL